MNMSIDEYLHSLEHAAKRLPSLMTEWHDLDDSLREEYASQYEWLVEERENVLALAADARRADVALRIAVATAELHRWQHALASAMCIYGIVPASTASHAVTDSASPMSTPISYEPRERGPWSNGTTRNDHNFAANDNAYELYKVAA